MSQKGLLIKKIKTVNENVHAVLVDLDDEKTELLVAFLFYKIKTNIKLLKSNNRMSYEFF